MGAIGDKTYKMKDIKLPIVELGNGGFQVEVDSTLYSKEVITFALYKYTDKFFIHQHTSNTPNVISVVFESKDASAPIEIDTFKQFCNDLIEQQVRAQVEAQFGHIRDLIVEEAFKPVNK
jgi:His-Xaa-Ser system protein HxsD